MRAPCLPAQWLPKPQRVERRLDEVRIQIQRRRGAYACRGPRYVVEILHATQTATGMAAQLPYTARCEIAMQVLALERNVERNAIIAWHDRDIRQLGSRRDSAFRKRKADREILQVVRRRHHHGIGKPAVAEGDRDFHCNANKPPFAIPILASRSYGDGYGGREVLKRTVHCAVRVMDFKAFTAQS